MVLQRLKNIWKWLKYFVAAVPIIWIYLKIDMYQMIATSKNVAPWTIPLYSIIVLLSMSLQGIRWWALTKVFIPSLSFKKAMSCHFAGLFYSIIIPGNTSQDVVRAFLVSKENDYSIVWGATWLSRILGLFVLAILSVYGLLAINKSLLPSGFIPSMISAFAVLFVLFLISFSKRITSPIRLATAKILPQKFLKIIENIRQAIYLYKNEKRAIIVVGIITLLMQLLLVSAACIAIWGITGKLLIFECMAFIPMIELLCIAIPLTPNGLGIRESLLSIMFLHIGLTSGQLGIYILFGFYSISLKLFGGIPILLGFTKSKTAKAPSL